MIMPAVSGAGRTSFLTHCHARLAAFVVVVAVVVLPLPIKGFPASFHRFR